MPALQNEPFHAAVLADIVDLPAVAVQVLLGDHLNRQQHLQSSPAEHGQHQVRGQPGAGESAQCQLIPIRAKIEERRKGEAEANGGLASGTLHYLGNLGSSSEVNAGGEAKYSVGAVSERGKDQIEQN